MALLRVKKGSDAGSLFPVFSSARPTVIGRDEGAEATIADGRASRRHAAIYCNRGRWILADLESSNGTFVGTKRIKKVQLVDGRTFQIGTTLLSFHENELVPIDEERRGVRTLDTICEEAGVFTCRGHQTALDRDVRVDLLHPSRALADGEREVVLAAFDEARRLRDERFLDWVDGAAADAGTAFTVHTGDVSRTLADELAAVLAEPFESRVAILGTLVALILERATWEHLRYAITPRHIACEPLAGGGHTVRLARLDLGGLIADLRGDTRNLSHYASYLPPELQLPPEERSNAPPLASAMYNCGCLGYHLLTGQPPMGEGDVSTLLSRHRELTPAPPSVLVAGFPEKLSALLEQMLEKDPAQRPVGRRPVLDVVESFARAPRSAAAPTLIDDDVDDLEVVERIEGLEEIVPEGPTVAERPVATGPAAARPVARPAPRRPAPQRLRAARAPVESAAESTPSGWMYVPLWIATWIGLFLASMYVSKDIFRRLAE